MQTSALAAYVQSRKMKFAGAPVTLAKILQMWRLPHDGGETIDGVALEGVARYCKLSIADLSAAVEAMQPPPAAPRAEPKLSPPPAPMPTTFATVTIPPIAPPAPAPEPPPVIIETTRTAPDPTAVMPPAQLDNLVAATRPSSPVIAAPEPLAGPEDDEVDISFEEVEATPIPESAEAASTSAPAADADAKSKKKNKRKKKS